MYISQERTTYTVPFVPSEEREWPSVIIPITPFPPEQQMTPTGATWSTNLNETGIQIPQVLRL
jgi:hypothetical protein